MTLFKEKSTDRPNSWPVPYLSDGVPYRDHSWLAVRIGMDRMDHHVK